MKRITIHAIFIYAFFGTTMMLTSCDDDLETDDLAPFFNLEFINQTAINSLTPLIDSLDTSITSITDSLSFLDSLTNAGDTRDFTDNIEALTTTRTLLSANRTEAQSLLDDAESGLLLINSIATFEGDEPRVFQDSASEYTLPLNANANSSIFRISIGNMIYTLETEYERNTIVKERSVIVEALNFNVIEEGTSFNNVTLVCQDTVNCTSNEATVTLFF